MPKPKKSFGNSYSRLDEAITTLVVSLDGAYVLMREDGYREAIVGNISLYDVTGKRQHTVYIGEAPEYGKGTIFQRLEKEIATVKKHYPDLERDSHPLEYTTLPSRTDFVD